MTGSVANINISHSIKIFVFVIPKKNIEKSKNTYLQLEQNMLEYSYNEGELLYDEQLKHGDPN